MCGMLWLPVRPRETGGTNVIPLTASPSWSSTSASDCRSGKYGLQLTSPIGTQSFLAEPRSLTLLGHVSSCTWKGHDPDLAGVPTQGGGTGSPVGTYSVGGQGNKVFRDCRRLQEISQVRPHSPWGPPPGTVTLLPLRDPGPAWGPPPPVLGSEAAEGGPNQGRVGRVVRGRLAHPTSQAHEAEGASPVNLAGPGVERLRRASSLKERALSR